MRVVHLKVHHTLPPITMRTVERSCREAGQQQQPQTGLSARSGFTLTELLVTLAILTIVAAILIPTVGTIRERASLSEDMSNLRQIGVLAGLYTADNEGFYPTLRGIGEPSDTSWVGPFWTESLMQYLDIDRLPEVEIYDAAGMDESHRIGGYGGNIYIFNNDPTDPIQVSEVEYPARTIMACNATIERNYQSSGILQGSWFINSNLFRQDPYAVSNHPLPFPGRHGKIATLFCDGHVRAMDREAMAERSQELVGDAPWSDAF